MHEGNVYSTYILSSESGTLYIGVTNDIRRRLAEHISGLVPGFTSKYGCKKLVYFENFFDISEAIGREKTLKGWLRKKKEALIKSKNPGWRDLSQGWKLPEAHAYDG